MHSRFARSLLGYGPTGLTSPPADSLGGKFGVAFDSIPDHEMPQFMPDAPECRIAIGEHTGREVDPPDRQVGIGESGPVGMKGGPALQELVMFEDHKGQCLLEIGGVAKQPR